MSRLRVKSFTISMDGFGAGPNQDMSNPLGVGGMSLGYSCTRHVATSRATHLVLSRD